MQAPRSTTAARVGEKAQRLSARRSVAIDLFSGAGGMTLGFEQAGFDVLVAAECGPIHAATHRVNFPLARHAITTLNRRFAARRAELDAY